MMVPGQSPPVSRTLAGDYVVRDARVIWVPWRDLTQAERERLWRLVMVGQPGGGVHAAGGC